MLAADVKPASSSQVGESRIHRYSFVGAFSQIMGEVIPSRDVFQGPG